MPRVLLTGFCAVPGPRRAGVQLRHVIRALTPLHSVDVLVVREGDQAYVERQGTVRVLRVPTHEAGLRPQIQAFQRALKRQLDGADYDFVHCRDSWAGVPVLEARARLRYAMVYDLARSPLGDTTGDAELDAQYARDADACLRAADLVLAPTPDVAKALHGRGKPDRIVLSPPGVDIDRFDWDDPPTGGPPRILYVGSIDPGRGVRVLVRAMAAIVREVDARLVLAGAIAPGFEQPLRQAVRELGLTEQVEILGPVDHEQVPALLATATVCVVPAAADLTPSPAVVFPTKLLEYMACRRAVVAPRRDTLAHVVENNREALLFEAGDAFDLARKVLRLLGEPRLRERIAQNAYERVRRDFTASATRRALRRAYQVLGERFAVSLVDTAAEDVPKIELLADDDFEATVFEEAPVPRVVDAVLDKLLPLDEALRSLAEADATGSSELALALREPDETIETIESEAVPARDGQWSNSALVPPPPGDDWGGTSVAEIVRAIEVDDLEAELLIEEGTPIDGIAVGGALSAMETSFVAGEIDVPTPPSLERRRREDQDDARAHEPKHDTPAVDPTPRALLSAPDPDPDTGNRTPPFERF